ncbi:MAG: hypothetical protein CM1200mP33_0630 [Chloroflexota bacterium]|nr:MAG: hypothetical protein CM1200mP33_0630 [Chloroflexota bacterium]
MKFKIKKNILSEEDKKTKIAEFNLLITDLKNLKLGELLTDQK